MNFELPGDLQGYADSRNFRGIFEDMFRMIFSGNLPASESHLRIKLLKFLQERHTTYELDSIGLQRKPLNPYTGQDSGITNLGVQNSNFSPNNKIRQTSHYATQQNPNVKPPLIHTDIANPQKLEKSLVNVETSALLGKLERQLKTEAEIENVRKELFLSFEDVEELHNLFKKFDTDETGFLTVIQLVYAFDYYYRNNAPQLSLSHAYFEAVTQNEDYQHLKFTEFLRVASLIDETHFLNYAENIGFSLEFVNKIKTLCLETVPHRDPCFLFRKTIDVHHVVTILRALGCRPSQKHVTAYLRKNVIGLGDNHNDDVADRRQRPRIDFREFLVCYKFCPSDHEARAQKMYRIPDDHLKAYRNVFDSYNSRDNGYLPTSELRLVFAALGIELPESVIQPLLREALEDPLNLDLMGQSQKGVYNTEWLDFIEFLAVIRKYHQGASGHDRN